MPNFKTIAALLATAVSTLAFAQAVTAPDYVTKAGAGNAYETASSQLVLQSTQNSKIRDFASMMVADHSKSTGDVKRAAQRDGVPVVAPKLEPEQEQMIADLGSASGSARDQLYLSQQKAAHEQALALHSGYAQSGDKAALKRVATATARVVQQHIDMLKKM